MKKIKKLSINIDTISNLTNDGMKNINGGIYTETSYDTVSADLPGYCGAASHYNDCGSYVASGTGYGMCCCNATGNCH